VTDQRPLATQLATLRQAIEQEPAPFWVPAVLHAMIIGLLCDILGRLEHLVHLWVTGQLPALSPPRRDLARQQPPPRPCRHRAATSRRRARRAPLGASPRRAIILPRRAAPHLPPARLPLPQGWATPPRTAAQRAPPRPPVPISGAHPGPRSHALNVP
jgi:hypothetical protein